MDGKPPPPPPQSPAGGDAQEPERYGPVQVRRLLKDDGRALILYRRLADER